MNHSDAIVQFFDVILNENKCFDLAKKNQFIQRSSSKLKGYEFIKAMIIPSQGLSTDSLQGICKRVEDFNPDAKLSAQALSLRINSSAAKELMKNVFATLLQSVQSKIIDNCPKLNIVLGQFNAVYIEDSTVAKLNEKLQKEFAGTTRGGFGAKSQIKIDLIYNVLKGIIVNVDLHNGKEPDQGLASKIIKFIQPNDLVIRDLGYFVLKSLRNISELGGYFLSRWQSNVKIFLKKDDLCPVNLGNYIDKNYSNYNIIDIPQVFLGDEKLPSRLILYRQPKEIVEKKRREANKRAKETGRQMSSSKKLCLQFAIFVTNVPKNMLEAKIVGTIYRLRWEIELIFKRWKSQLQIDYLKGIDKNRIECLIWSRLCTIIIIEIITCYISRVVERNLIILEISHIKLIKYIHRNNKFCEAIMKNRVEEFLKNMEKDILRMLLKDKRKRKTMRERVFLCESYYEMQPSNFKKVA